MAKARIIYWNKGSVTRLKFRGHTKGRSYTLSIEGMLKMAWYVLFVKTGCEHRAETEISKTWKIEDIHPFVPMYDAYFKRSGKRILEKRRLFPGYIFIESKIKGTEFYTAIKPFIAQSENTLKLLRYGEDYDDHSFEMHKEEQQSLMNIYNDEYCIEISQGFIEGNAVTITNGSLLGLENRIKKINRHKMEAVVEIQMMGTIREMTVGLEIVGKTHTIVFSSQL